MRTRTPRTSNRELWLPYALPYLAYVTVAALPSAWLARELDYALRLIACGAALAWGARRYRSLRGPRSAAASAAIGAAVGVAALPLWIALLVPHGSAAAGAWTGSAFALRLVATATAVALAEELLMRGYVLRVAVLWDRARRAGRSAPLHHALDASLHEVEPGAWTPAAVAASTLLFAVGHAPHEWLAAAAYGLLMAALWIRRGDLVACIAAHATTNAALAFYIQATGSWHLW